MDYKCHNFHFQIYLKQRWTTTAIILISDLSEIKVDYTCHNFRFKFIWNKRGLQLPSFAFQIYLKQRWTTTAIISISNLSETKVHGLQLPSFSFEIYLKQRWTTTAREGRSAAVRQTAASRENVLAAPVVGKRLRAVKQSVDTFLAHNILHDILLMISSMIFCS